MSRLVLKAFAAAALAGVGGGAGYLLGHARGDGTSLDRLQLETSGNLSRRVEVLSRLRTGDTVGAIELTEQSVDIAVRTLPQRKDWSELPEPVKVSLMQAKVYRTAYPPDAGADAALTRILSGIPLLPPDHQFCSPALGRVAEGAGR